MEKFRWAFIGAGTLAKKVAEEITASGRHEIASVYTRSYEKCVPFAQKYQAHPAKTAEEAISLSGVDGVYIVTPHNSHYEYAKLALTLGRPVLCEKPLTTDAVQAEELVALAQEKQLYFAEAMWTWFSPVAHQVKKWLDDGEYGEIETLTISYHMKSTGYAPRVTDPNTAGGALLDVGVYPVTYLYRLFGDPTAVKCTGKLKDGIDLGEDIELTFADGRTYTARVSIVDYKGLERLCIRGSKGRTDLPFYHNANAVKLRRVGGKDEKFRAYGGMLNEFDRVSDEIRAGLTESRCVPHQATLDVMRILDECRRQMGLVYPFETRSRLLDTPIGPILIAEDGQGICSLRFAPGQAAPAPTGEKGLYLDDAERQLREYFAGERRAFDLPLSVHGTPFQTQVWDALRNIPYGETRSYQQIAQTIGNARAVRAVGMANNRNPIPILIPCHRVVGKDGALTGYAGGLERKQYLLDLEAAR